MANFMQMMQKAQKMKSRMQEMQDQAENLILSGEAGGGSVTCQMNGKFAVTKISIAPAALAGGDAEMLEDLVLAALNDARGKAEARMAEETEKIMRELGLPPGMGLPF
jgi:DNA-binding YbaB/EbfC family protein